MRPTGKGKKKAPTMIRWTKAVGKWRATAPNGQKAAAQLVFLAAEMIWDAKGGELKNNTADVCEAVGIPRASYYRWMNILKEAGFLDHRRTGRYINLVAVFPGGEQDESDSDESWNSPMDSDWIREFNRDWDFPTESSALPGSHSESQPSRSETNLSHSEIELSPSETELSHGDNPCSSNEVKDLEEMYMGYPKEKKGKPNVKSPEPHREDHLPVQDEYPTSDQHPINQAALGECLPHGKHKAPDVDSVDEAHFWPDDENFFPEPVRPRIDFAAIAARLAEGRAAREEAIRASWSG